MTTEQEKHELAEDLNSLRLFIGPRQLQAMVGGLSGEERDHFVGLFAAFAARCSTMPKTGDTEDNGNPIAFLHYFSLSGQDWYITERDVGVPEDNDFRQCQAFGWAELFPGGGEFGYISIEELVDNNIELDLYFEPRPIKAVLASREGRG